MNEKKTTMCIWSLFAALVRFEKPSYTFWWVCITVPVDDL